MPPLSRAGKIKNEELHENTREKKKGGVMPLFRIYPPVPTRLSRSLARACALSFLLSCTYIPGQLPVSCPRSRARLRNVEDDCPSLCGYVCAAGDAEGASAKEDTLFFCRGLFMPSLSCGQLARGPRESLVNWRACRCFNFVAFEGKKFNFFSFPLQRAMLYLRLADGRCALIVMRWVNPAPPRFFLEMIAWKNLFLYVYLS